MPLYWRTSTIPAMKALSGLPKKEQWEYIQPVIGGVLSRWQVWLPIALFLVCAAVFILVVPSFPYRLPVAIVAFVSLGKIASLPYNHYLNEALAAEWKRRSNDK
jgi:hypothetical protein